ncbi:MAG: FixH family protein [Planctomycetota bacterium]
MTTPIAADDGTRILDAAAETRAKLTWVSIVVGLLGLQVLLGGFSAYCALSDTRDGVLPDYYRQGLDWDGKRAATAASAETGWVASLHVAGDTDIYGHRVVELTLTDAAGSPVEGASVSCELFAHTEASRLTTLDLAPVADRPGVYVATPEMRRHGLWTIAAGANRGRETFVGSWEHAVGREI